MQMLLAPRRIALLVVFIGIVVFLAWFLPQTLNPVKKSREARDAERRWVNTSPYWLDRQACRWLSLCGLMHIKTDPPGSKDEEDGDEGDLGHELRRRGLSREAKQGRQRILISPTGKDAPERGDDDGDRGDKAHGLRGIPDYVLDYAPLVHLYSEEFFWPADIADHIKHMEPYADETRINLTAPLGLANLHSLHNNAGDLFLRSKNDVEARPPWLHNWDNVPASYADGDRGDDHRPAMESGGAYPPSERTTWFDVDRDHPLRRISDPRELSGGSTGYAPLPKGRPGDLRRRREERRNVPLTGAPAAAAAAAEREGEENKPDESGYSGAPVTLVLVDKGSGIVDAFWFFFYAYNLGQSVLGVRYGNHVGDWEHAMVRFDAGVPRAVFLSEHEGGQTYAWHALEKRRGPGNSTDGGEALGEKLRPVLYSAVGSHAMYAMPGDHPYILPFNMLKDQTDRGPLWDPRKNFRAYWYDYTVEEQEQQQQGQEDAEPSGAPGNATTATAVADRGLAPVREQPDNPTGWFHYGGRWGDRLYGLDDRRQWRLFGQYHYVTGPEGPKSKNLGRERMCMRRGCRILQSIAEGRSTSWHS